MAEQFNYKDIERRYGWEVKRNVGTLKRLSEKLGRYKSHIRFNLHCKHKDVIPGYAKIKAQEDSEEVRRIIHKAERAIVNVHIGRAIKKKEEIERTIERKQQKIRETMREEEIRKIEEMRSNTERKTFERTRDIQKKKFEKFANRQNKNKDQQTRNNEGREERNEENEENERNSKRWVKNISSTPLTEAQLSLLKKGANYAITPTKLPIDDYIVATEQAARNLHRGEAAAMRAEIVEILQEEEKKKIPSNLTAEERRAIKELKENEEIIIVPADKGRCLVVMDKSEYSQKMREKLADQTTYKPLKEDPTKEIQEKLTKQLQKMKDDGEIDQKTYLKLFPNKTQIPECLANQRSTKKETHSEK